MNTHDSMSTIPRPTGWHAIDWRASHTRVRKLQLRIAEATRQQQWRRVRELQRILTRSFSGKAVAVRRVTENTGRRTPGVDGKTWSTPDGKTLHLTRAMDTPIKRHIKIRGDATPLFARYGNLLRAPPGPDLDRETEEDENRGGIVECIRVSVALIADNSLPTRQAGIYTTGSGR